jgi:hypothetical protein
MFQVFRARTPSDTNIKETLGRFGIEIISLEAWPGFSQNDFAERDEYQQRIGEIWEENIARDVDEVVDPYKKAKPEAEAVMIVNKERIGRYHIIADPDKKSSAWFISQTSLLNVFSTGPRITWQPEAFLRFASTLSPALDSRAADQAFESILLGIAEAGLCLLDDNTASTVFGGVIDQAKLQSHELTQSYHQVLEQKYGEPAEQVLARVKPIARPLAALLLANEIIQAQEERLLRLEAETTEANRRAKALEKDLQAVASLRNKMKVKQERAKQRQRSSQNKQRRKKRK